MLNVIMLIVIMLSFVMLSVVMLIVIMLSVVMLSVVMLIVVILSVTAPSFILLNKKLIGLHFKIPQRILDADFDIQFQWQIVDYASAFHKM
jgi:hypothetical protein